MIQGPGLGSEVNKEHKILMYFMNFMNQPLLELKRIIKFCKLKFLLKENKFSSFYNYKVYCLINNNFIW